MAIQTAEQLRQAQISVYLRLFVWIRRSEYQLMWTFTFVVASSNFCSKRANEVIAGWTTAMHLNGEIIAISSLFLDETGCSLRNDFYLGDTRETSKLNETINVVEV